MDLIIALIFIGLFIWLLPQILGFLFVCLAVLGVILAGCWVVLRPIWEKLNGR